MRFPSILLAAATDREASGVESVLRGWMYHWFFSARKLKVGRGVQFVVHKNIRLGGNVTFYGHAYVNAAGERGRVEIGDCTHIDQFCVLYGQGGLKIGSRCAIASGVIIYTQSNQYAFDPESDIIEQPVYYAPVTIGDDVWIGAGAIILPGVSVGDHAVIGAGALVHKNVDPWMIAAGVPARMMGDRRARKARSVEQGP